MTEGLENPANWVNDKTWIVPLVVTIKVDDPSKYNAQMNTLIQNIVNELRGVSRNFDKSGKQLSLRTGEPLRELSDKEVDKIVTAGLGSKLKDDEAEDIKKELSTIKEMLSQLMEEKKDKKKWLQ